MASTSTPTPKSRLQILGDMLASYSASQGLKKVKVGGPILSIFEAASQSDAKQIATVLQALQAQDLDSIGGLALELYGNSKGIPKLAQTTARGSVTISDSSFDKVDGQLSHTESAPIAGSEVIYVTRTDGWLKASQTGNLYLGRGSPNYEGPLAFTSIVDNGVSLAITLSSPTTVFHNQGESVVLAQGGNRIISSSQGFTTSQGALTSAVGFRSLYQYTLPDGETEIDGVSIICNTPGSAGNVPAGAISKFQGSPPFTGATVINFNSITNGRDVEIDEDYRTRIKQEQANQQRGVDQAIINSVVGLQDDIGETITSAFLKKIGKASVLYVDDGTGYEETSEGIGIEVITDSAMGGEDSFETNWHQVAKAFVVSNNSAPFVLHDGSELAVIVGGVAYSHVFGQNEFLDIGNANAYEVISSINSDPSFPVSARTVNNGTQIALEARSETNEDIEVEVISETGIVDSNYSFQFPVSRRYTSTLYLNDIALSKDGFPATVYSSLFGKWGSITGSQTLNVVVDQTPAVTYTFTDTDFITYKTGFNIIGKNSLNAWATVFNHRIPGLTFVVNSNRLKVASNKGNNSEAQISITAGTLVSAGMFGVQAVTGYDNDYSLDRATGKIILTNPLEVGDRLTLGSNSTRAFLETPRLSPTNLTDSIRLWVSVDSDAIIRQHGITSGTPLVSSVTALTPTTYQISLINYNSSDPFSNVKPGDWALFYDYSNEISAVPTSLKNAYKVVSEGLIGTGVYEVVIEKPEAKVARYESAMVTLGDGRVMVIGGKTAGFDSNTADLDNPGSGITNTCEIFTIPPEVINTSDSTIGAWAKAASLLTARAGHTATVLNTGKVLVVGGRGQNGTILSSAELYDPVTNTWASTLPYPIPVVYHTANSLALTNVLITGGLTTNGSASNLSFEYNTYTNTWTNPGYLTTGRYKHAALKLNCSGGGDNNNVLVAGGWNSGNLKSVELYNVSTHSWSTKTDMHSARECFSLVQASKASPFNVIAIGSSSRSAIQRGTYSIYDAFHNTWGADTVISAYEASHGSYTVSFENSRIGTIYNSGAGTWTLVAPYVKRSDGKAVHLTWSGSDWVPIQDSLGISGGLVNSYRQDVMVAEVGSTYGSNLTALCFGGYSPSSGTFMTPYSMHELFTLFTGTWMNPSDAVDTDGFYISNTTGLVFVNSKIPPLYAEIPIGTNYIASGFVSSLNNQLEGCVASVYRTSALRLATSNYKGSLLVIANSDETNLPLEVGVLRESQTQQNGTVLSGNSRALTPLDFTVQNLNCPAPSTSDSVSDISLPLTKIPLATSSLMGLKTPDLPLAARTSNWQGYTANIASTLALGLSGASYNQVEVGLRSAPNSLLASGQPVVLLSPFQIGPYDNFNVKMDKDSATGLFNIPMYRNLVPTDTSAYGSTLTLTESSGASLASTFGINYKFEDFAVYMKARAQTHIADSTKSAIWRYWRYGQDGESFGIRYSYPTVASSAAKVTITHDQDTLDLTGQSRSTINIVLPGGAARTGASIQTSTRLGLACNEVSGWTTGKTYESYLIAGFTIKSYSRTVVGGATKLTLTMPTNLIHLGIQVGDILYFNAVNPNTTTLYSGPFAVSQVDDPSGSDFNVWVPAGILCESNAPTVTGDNPGTVSIDPLAKVGFPTSIITGDLVNLQNHFTGEAAKYTNTTMRVLEVDPNFQWLRCSFSNLLSATPAQAPVYAQVAVPVDIKTFAGSTATVANIVSAVNALSNAPVTGAVLGSGTGVISEASWDEQSLQAAYYPLTDGINFVQRTIAPDISTGDVQLLLKTPVSASLASDSDWANEVVRLSPQTAENIVQWFNTPAITGLWSKAEIVNTVEGNIQISSLSFGGDSGVEVLGGLANSLEAPVYGAMHVNAPQDGYDASALITIKRSDSDGFVGGRWAEITNTSRLAKTGIIGLQISKEITSINAATKRWNVSGPLYNINSALRQNAVLEIQKVGRYVVVSFDVGGITFASIDQTGYLHIEAPTSPHTRLSDTSSNNQGTFPILSCSLVDSRIQVWIENSNVTEESSYGNVHFREFDSLGPQDVITISSNDFGVGNRKTFTVNEVGYSNSSYYFITEETPASLDFPVTLAASNLPKVFEGPTRKAIKNILSVSPNQTNSAYVDLKVLNTTGVKSIGQAAGSIIKALDKLEFPLGFNAGSDSYKYNTGLIGAASTQIYGNPLDSTQSGYVANGATVLVAGTKVKRFIVSLAIRATSKTQALIDQVKTSVASFVNGHQAGPVAISDLITAAKVPGVTAVSVISPAYSSVNDMVSVSAYEKLMIIDINNDILISFVGD